MVEKWVLPGNEGVAASRFRAMVRRVAYDGMASVFGCDGGGVAST